MPAPKYECEYCEKSFADTPASRRRHMQGGGHKRNRRLWYDAFKEPCPQWLQGRCPRGYACELGHPPKADRSEARLPDAVAALLQESLELAAARKAASDGGGPAAGSDDGPAPVVGALEWAHDGAAALGSLPPSLQPPPLAAKHHDLPPVDWG